jgi:hypothetical protein
VRVGTSGGISTDGLSQILARVSSWGWSHKNFPNLSLETVQGGLQGCFGTPELSLLGFNSVKHVWEYGVADLELLDSCGMGAAIVSRRI